MVKERGNLKLRRLDALLGVPVLLGISAFRTRRALPRRIDSVGLLRTSCIGDTVLLSAIAADLQSALPRAKLLFFAGNTNFEAARLFLHDEQVRRIPVTSPFRAAQTLRLESLDVLLDFGPWPRIDALIAALAGARCTIGFKTPGQLRHFCYDVAVSHSREVHELNNYRNLTSALGIRTTHSPRLMVEGPPPLEFDKYLVFHLWAGGYLSKVREWPIEGWMQLAEYAGRHDYQIVLTGARSDSEANNYLLKQIARKANVFNVAGRFNLFQTARLLLHARAVVSINTGIMHLAAALGVPTVGLNGPTSIRRWGAIGPNVRNVTPEVSDCGYLHLGFEYKGQRLDCMQQITVDSVWQALQETIAQ
jgi:heptosyltransferase III